MTSIHQVNHPGQELNIKHNDSEVHKNDFYFFPDSNKKGIRLWNRCSINGKDNSHKRKFIEHSGKYVDPSDLTVEREGILRFWGEYEGHSEFELLSESDLKDYWNHPTAVHRPFFSTDRMNDQNTDPYIFGDNFYYAICKKSKLGNLSKGDLILFGSEFGPREKVDFYLDTLFVVFEEQPSILDNTLYDYIYQQSTLNKIGISDCAKGEFPIHTGIKFSTYEKIFSFFPAKLADNQGFGRPIIDTEKLGLQVPGARTGAKSINVSSKKEAEEIWLKIVSSVQQQGFVLGTHANNLPVLKKLP